MKIRNVIHKGLRKLIEDDNAASLQPAVADKLRKIVSFLQEMEQEEELRSIPSLESPSIDWEPKGCVEPFCDQELAHHIQHR